MTRSPGTLGDLLRNTVERVPQREALVFVDETGTVTSRITYSGLLQGAERVARRLCRDLPPGSRVAIWSGNRPEWVVVEFGIALAGMVLVAVNPDYTPDEAHFVLADAAVALLFADAEHRGASRVPTVRAVAAASTTLKQVVDIAGIAAWAGDDAGALPVVSSSDPAHLLYTSGTTGQPKGALLHHHGLTLTPPTASRLFELGDEPRWLNAMPMFHIGGCGLPTIGSVAIGGTHVMAQRYRSSIVPDLVSSERITFFGGVPAMIQDLMHARDPRRHDWSRLRLLLSGAAAVSPSLVTEVEERLEVRFVLAYGQTEAHGHIAQTRPADSAQDKAFTIGRPLPHVEVKVVDTDTGRPAQNGEQGELWARSPAVMTGYVNRPDATAHALPGDGWLRTGDICRQDERGYLTFVARTGDIINRGGEKFSPRDIEEALRAHPAVADAAVLGVPDARLGQRVAAFVCTRDGAGDPAVLRTHLESRITGYKIPEHWVFVEALPRTTSGKVARHRLQELWVARG